MPRSKHRRKPGGKAIRNPGRARAAASPNAETAFGRFNRKLRPAFHEAFPGEEARAHDVEFLMDGVLDATFDGTGLTARPASKAALFAHLVGPAGAAELDDGMEPYTAEMAEAGLALLVERQVVVVEGDRIALHPRLADTKGTPQPERPV